MNTGAWFCGRVLDMIVAHVHVVASAWGIRHDRCTRARWLQHGVLDMIVAHVHVGFSMMSMMARGRMKRAARSEQ